MVFQNQLVSWCIADCTSGPECEIGIRTRPDYRRQGLASLTAAATVDYCLSHGFTKIGWHTDDDNLGSIGVAENVGFVRAKDYQQYYCMFDEAIHFAETGYRQFQAEQYSKVIESFDEAFKKKEMPNW